MCAAIKIGVFNSKMRVLVFVHRFIEIAGWLKIDFLCIKQIGFNVLSIKCIFATEIKNIWKILAIILVDIPYDRRIWIFNHSTDDSNNEDYCRFLNTIGHHVVLHLVWVCICMCMCAYGCLLEFFQIWSAAIFITPFITFRFLS